MTYQQLLMELLKFTEDQLEANVTVFESDTAEFFPIQKLAFVSETDVLEKNHPFLVFS